MTKNVKKIIEKCMNLYEFERKQIISILIMTTLTDISNDDAREIYNSVIDKLNK